MLRKTGKQLDKLSQWTGEKFFAGDRTELSSELREMEKDVVMRRMLVERLHATSLPYHSSLSKLKPSTDPYTDQSSSSKDRFLPGESLGNVMISCGEEVQRNVSGSGSGGMRRYGECLERMGRARVGVAMIQEEFAARLEEGYMAGTEAALDVVKEYQASRKKLDSRRLALDAAQKKLNGSKKENRGLEEEVEKAQERFEEIQSEVESRIAAVQECEDSQMADLESFLEAEMEFVEKYHEILKGVRSDWGSGSSSSSLANRPRAKSTSAVTKSTNDRPSLPSRLMSRPNLPKRTSNSRLQQASSDEDRPTPTSATKSNNKNRDRADSAASAGGGSIKKEKTGIVGALGALGRKRADSAGGGIGKRFGGGGSSSSGKAEKYGFLDGDDDEHNGFDDREVEGYDYAENPAERPSFDEDGMEMGSSSGLGSRGYEPPAPAFMNRARSHSSGSTSGSVYNPAIGRHGTSNLAPSHRRTNTSGSATPSLPTVRVLFSYTSTADDELSLDVGDLIKVTKEVSAGWWIGENVRSGEGGLFPRSYTRVEAEEDVLRLGDFEEGDGDEVVMETRSAGRATPTTRTLPPAFGSSPMNPGNKTTGRSIPPPLPHATSSSSSSTSLPKSSGSDFLDEIGRRAASPAPGSSTTKKAPPPIPPPMSRRNTNSISSATPPSSFQPPQNASRMLVPNLSAPLMGRARSGSATAIRGTGSPFGGSDEEDGVSGEVGNCGSCGCDDFTQNVFKAEGTCSSCFHQH